MKAITKSLRTGSRQLEKIPEHFDCPFKSLGTSLISKKSTDSVHSSALRYHQLLIALGTVIADYDYLCLYINYSPLLSIDTVFTGWYITHLYIYPIPFKFILYKHLSSAVDSTTFWTQLESLQKASLGTPHNNFPFKQATGADLQSFETLVNEGSKEPSWWVWVTDENVPSSIEEWSGIDNDGYLIVSEEHACTLDNHLGPAMPSAQSVSEVRSVADDDVLQTQMSTPKESDEEEKEEVEVVADQSGDEREDEEKKDEEDGEGESEEGDEEMEDDYPAFGDVSSHKRARLGRFMVKHNLVGKGIYLIPW
ncbi:hypothetical protein GIB67_015297 [Kingdonia uniflora]|uniref:Uncharacterized protein n=1 Tax=Kingdonia uniflora TaxID=39325 RepID=A0A7J7MST8_9MAGN|nr:hypothetical protein GIB67_015297 [Kingdonia uniflora]